MIGTIRKHQTWLWVLIITLTIITFVFWGANTGKLQSGGPSDYGRISGEPVSRTDFFNARNEAELHAFLSSGEWPDKDRERQMRDTYQWLFIVQKEQDLGIHVPEEVVAKAATARLINLNRGKPLSLADFTKQVLQPRGLTADDFERYMRHLLGFHELQKMITVGSSVTPMEEIKALYARENEEFSTQAAFFSASNYLDQVTATPETVTQYYTNHMAEYRIPERMTVSYIRFPISNHVEEVTKRLAAITNMDELVEAAYQRQGGTNTFKDKTPEQAKQEIREKDFKMGLRQLAANKANDVASRIYDFKIRPQDFAEFGRTNGGLTVEVSQPFDRQDPPKDLKVDDGFVRTAFSLNADEPFAGPLPGDDSVYVITTNKRIPSENPPFETVRDKVTWDYKFSQAATLARAAGESFNQAVTNGLAAGKGFVSICSEAKVKPVLPAPFSLVSTSLPPVETFVPLGQYKRVVLMTPVKKASPFIPMREGGLLVYVDAKLPLDATRMNAELPRFAQAVRQERQNEAFNMWFSQEAGRALRETPLGRQQPQVSGAPGQ